MRLSMRERRRVVDMQSKRYQASGKKQRSVILDEFTHVTKYRRSYAAWLLANWKKHRVLTIGGVRTVYIFGVKKARKGHAPPKRPKTYGSDIVRQLKLLWALAGGLCGKRLAPFIRTSIPVLERFEEIHINGEQKRKLLTISPATIDRLLAPERQKYRIKGRATTRPGSLLKHQVPIRTFSDWDEHKPGFMEVDSVAHDGGFPSPDVLQSLTLTDIATTWTVAYALKTRARRWVLEALQDTPNTVPFPILGIDSDNGSEFINEDLLIYCREHHITFTRSRPYRKNDSCFVEQKNYTIVRRTVGYDRLDTEEELRLLQELYPVLGLFTNYFQPAMKLVKKTRTGARVKKVYDKPQTPYQRVLDHPSIDPNVKAKLRTIYKTLNPAELRRTISRIQEQLAIMAQRQKHLREGKKRTHLESILR
jgi:hypothetical protein